MVLNYILVGCPWTPPSSGRLRSLVIIDFLCMGMFFKTSVAYTIRKIWKVFSLWRCASNEKKYEQKVLELSSSFVIGHQHENTRTHKQEVLTSRWIRQSLKPWQPAEYFYPFQLHFSKILASPSNNLQGEETFLSWFFIFQLLNR